MRKYLLILSAFALAACSSQPEPFSEKGDLKDGNFRGDVKRVKTIKYYAVESGSGLSKGEIYSDKDNAVNHYDKNGMIYLSELIGADGEVYGECRTEYDDNGNKVKQIHQVGEAVAQIWTCTYSPDGGRVREERAIGVSLDNPEVTSYNYENGRIKEVVKEDAVRKYSYDSNNRLVSELEIVEDGRVRESIYYFYDSEDQYLGREEAVYDLKSIGVVKKKFDPANKLVRIETSDEIEYLSYNSDGNEVAKRTDAHIAKYLYKYDKKGNWIERIESTECVDSQACGEKCDKAKTFITVREIKYR